MDTQAKGRYWDESGQCAVERTDCGKWGFECLARSHCSQTMQGIQGPPIESSIAVEDAVENRSLYRVFVSHLF